MTLQKKLLGGALRVDDLLEFRDVVKQLIASRFRTCLRSFDLYRPLPHLDLLLNAVEGNPRFSSMRNFLSCMLEYYNREELCQYQVIPMTRPLKSAAWRPRKKRLTDAFISACRMVRQEVRPVLRRMERMGNALTREEMELIGKVRTVSRATTFLYLMFRFLYVAPLPKCLPVEVYRQVCEANRKMAEYYTPEGTEALLCTSEKRPPAICLGLDTAMLLFIYQLPQR